MVAGALVLVQVFFGLHYLAAKVLLEEIPPRAWALIRVGCAAVLMLALARTVGRRLPTDPGTLARLALFSLFGVVINQVCFVEGLSRTTPTHSSLINVTIPVGTLFFAVMLGRERLQARKVAALVAAVGGVLLILRSASSDPGAGPVLLGDLLTLVNATSYALFLVLSKRLISRIDALSATAVLLGFGTLGVALVGAAELASLDLAAVSPRVWGLGLFIVLFPTAGAYLISYWALARVESSVVAFFILLQPLIATTLSALWLRERPGPLVLAGAVLIFVGVFLVLTGRPTRRAER
jgi:drug/metabolite transporter (DMT)-like permease